MKKLLLIAILAFSACEKESEPLCEKWGITYWQGTKNKTTVTSNYYPHSEDKELCGEEKNNAANGKVIVIRQINADLFDYMTYNGKR